MTNLMLPQWKQKRSRRSLRLSPTQLESKRRCKRLWWFERIRKLRTGPQSKAKNYGTITHSVCERYLSADDLGRDTEGNPVDLYPEGWHIAYDKFTKKPDGEVTESEQGQIKKLMAAAIENGVIERRPDRAIEREFKSQLLTAEECGTDVDMVGFIDLEYVGEVQDHKTTGSTKWMKSARKLKEQLPMLIYAKQHLDFLRQRGAAVPKEITLRYNYFCKDWKNPIVKKVEARVTIAEIEEEWERVIEDAREMVHLRDTVEDGLSEIEDPDKSKENPCMAYGGCPYQRICSKTETVDQFETRIDKYSKEGYTDPQRQKDRPAMYAKGRTTKNEDQNMDFKTRLAQKAAEKTASGIAATPTMSPAKEEPAKIDESFAETPESKAADTKETMQVYKDTAPSGVAPPWAFEGCPACEGNGFNTIGKPCAICQHKSDINADKYVLEANEDATVTWVSKTDPDDCGVSPLPGKAEAKPVKAAETDTATEPEPEAPAKEEKPKRSRKKKSNEAETIATEGGFLLLINCVPVTDTPFIDLHQKLVEIGELMAAEVKDCKNFYDINAFDRRDALRKAGEEIANTLTGIVAVDGIGNGETDLKALCDGLRPFAKMVICSRI